MELTRLEIAEILGAAYGQVVATNREGKWYLTAAAREKDRA